MKISIKITVFISMLLCYPYFTNAMEITKNVRQILRLRSIQEIEADIKTTSTNRTLSEYQHHYQLGSLYDELHDAFIDAKRDDEAEGIWATCRDHREHAAQIKKQERLARQKEEKEQQKLSRHIYELEEAVKVKATTMGGNSCIEAIPICQELITLTENDPERQDTYQKYQKRLARLNKVKQRKEINEEMEILKTENNKPALIAAHERIIETYETEEKKQPHRLAMQQLQQEIATEKQQEAEEQQKMLERAQFQIKLISFESDIESLVRAKKLSDFDKKLSLAQLLEQRASHYKTVQGYEANVETDMKKSSALRYECVALAPTPQEQERVINLIMGQIQL